MALPAAIDPATPLATDSPGQGDDHIRALKQFIVDVFGLPASPTQVAAAAMSISAAGVLTLSQNNVLFQLGNVQGPSWAFAGRISTGVYSSAANTLDITAGGTRAASFTTATNAVNYVRMTPGATITPPIIDAEGSDTNISLRFNTKANGILDFFTGGSRAAQIARVSSSVNYLVFTPATLGNNVDISAAGSSTNIGITLTPKGTGALLNAVGAVGTPSYSFTGRTGDGIFSSASNNLGISLGGKSVFSILLSSGITSANIVSDDAGALGPTLTLFHDSASPADNDVSGLIVFAANDDTATRRTIAEIYPSFNDVTSTTMDSQLNFSVMNAVNAGNANMVATLTSLGVWTDGSAAAGKEYIGDVSNVLVKARQLSTLGVYRGKNLPVGKYADAEVHFSPTAEDFYQVFRLGKNPTKGNPGIAPKDVAFLAIRGLLELEDRVAALEAK